MKNSASVIVMIIVPFFLAICVIGFATRGYEGDLTMKWTDLIKAFSTFPDYKTWIGDANAEFIADANAVAEAWDNLKGVGDFFIAFGRTLWMGPRVVITFVGYLIYPVICLAYVFRYIFYIMVGAGDIVQY